MANQRYDLTDKLAVVTGASRGIGWHIARTLHEAGCRLAITGRDEQTIKQAAERVGQRCSAYVCDQADPQAVQRFAEAVLASQGVPGILVANAGGGWGRGTHVVDLSLDAWRQTIDTNLTGTFLVCKALLPAMIEKQRGDVFLISSMSGKRGDPGSSPYNASKFGLQGFAQSLTHEVRKHNIRVMVLNPSSVNTEREDSSPADGPGQHLHATDLAQLVTDLARLPGRTLVRDMDIWGTNPF